MDSVAEKLTTAAGDPALMAPVAQRPSISVHCASSRDPLPSCKLANALGAVLLTRKPVCGSVHRRIVMSWSKRVLAGNFARDAASSGCYAVHNLRGSCSMWAQPFDVQPPHGS